MELPPELKQALERLQAGVTDAADLETIRRALQAGQIVIATGERAVAIGGSADGAIIITGDIHIELNARQRADLECLLAARRYNIPSLPEHYVPREEFLDLGREARRKKPVIQAIRAVVDPVQPRDFYYALIDLAHNICRPRNPACTECSLLDVPCQYGAAILHQSLK
jgi:hypothetical protein